MKRENIPGAGSSQRPRNGRWSVGSEENQSQGHCIIEVGNVSKDWKFRRGPGDEKVFIIYWQVFIEKLNEVPNLGGEMRKRGKYNLNP